MLLRIVYKRWLLKQLALFLVLGAVSACAEELTLDTVNSWLQEKGTKVRDEDLREVASVTELTQLDLSGCGSITDDGVARLLSLSKLKSLNLSSCRRLTMNFLESRRSKRWLQVWFQFCPMVWRIRKSLQAY